MNHLYHILRQWLPQKDQMQWVLASIVSTEGAAYRKAGTMMMIDELGHCYGLLSGGCVEREVTLEARKVMLSGEPRIVQYNLAGTEDSWQSLIGCGGKITLLLQIVERQNDYLQLPDLFEAMERRQKCTYRQYFTDDLRPSKLQVKLLILKAGDEFGQRGDQHEIDHTDEVRSIAISVTPLCHLLLIGAGFDAEPLVAIAAGVLGWRVTIIDDRSGYAKAANFSMAEDIIREPLDSVARRGLFSTIDAAIVMSHNLNIDRKAIACLSQSTARYIGLLGSRDRLARIIEGAELTSHVEIYSPAGFDIGAELPESIALSILAECHAALSQASGVSLKELAS